ncbi:MAG: hypothetical protein HQL54_05305 [Magnetococcales bacterium]|nr:hypothetical protein [Magnetococcales bacterium]
MTAFAHFFSSMTGVAIFCLIISAVFFATLLSLYLRTNKVLRHINGGLRLLRRTENLPEEHDWSEIDADDHEIRRKYLFAINWDVFNRDLADSRLTILKGPWKTFVNNLNYTPPEKPKPITTTADPGYFFHDRSLLYNHLNIRLYNSIPNLLTGLGILGTFIGLVAGIHLAQKGMNAGPEEMRAALGDLMGGASLAFLTSICGISMSIIFSLLEKRRLYGVSFQIRRFVLNLTGRLDLKPAEETALSDISKNQERLFKELRQQTNQMKIFNSTIALSVSEAKNSYLGQGRFQQSIDQMVQAVQLLAPAGSIENTAAVVVPAAKEASAESVIGKHLSTFGESLTSINETLKRQTNTITASWQTAQETTQKQLSDMVQQDRDRLAASTQSISEQFKKSTSDLGDRLEQSVTDLAGVVSGMKSGHDELILLLNTTPQILVSTEKLVERFEQFHALFGDNMIAMDDMVEQMQQSKAGNLQALDQSEQFIQSLQNSQSQIGTDTKALGQVVSSAGEQMTHAANGLSQTAEKLMQAVGTMTTAASSSGAESTAATTGMQDLGSQISDQMAQTRIAISDMADSMSAMLAQMKKSDNTPSVADSVSDTMGQFSSRFNDQVQHSHTVMSALSESVRSILAEMRQLGVSTPDIANQVHQLTEGLHSFHTRMETKFDGFMTQLSGQLAADNKGDSQSRTLSQLTTNNDRMLEGINHASQQMTDQMLQAFSTLHSSIESMKSSQESMGRHLSVIPDLMKDVSRASSGTQSTSGNFEDRMGRLVDRLSQQMDDMSHSASAMLNNSMQNAEALHASQKRLSTDNASLHGAIQMSGESIQQAATELGTATRRLANTLSDSVGIAAETRTSLENIRDFARTFDTAQTSMRQLITPMEAASRSLSQAGDRLYSGFGKLDAVTQTMGQTQEVAQATLQAITLAHEQLQGVWTNYQSRFESVDNTLEHTFNNLNGGLGEFSHQVVDFVNGMDRHMENVADKFGVTIGGFGNRMDEMGNSLDEFISQISSNLLQPMEHTTGMLAEASQQFSITGDKIYSGVEKIEKVTGTLVQTQYIAQETLVAIGEAHRQLKAVWEEYQSRFETVDESLERTFINLSKGLNEFSGNIIGFIHNIDDNMGNVTGKLNMSIGEFGSKLDDMNESLSDFLGQLSEKQ